MIQFLKILLRVDFIYDSSGWLLVTARVRHVQLGHPIAWIQVKGKRNKSSLEIDFWVELREPFKGREACCVRLVSSCVYMHVINSHWHDRDNTFNLVQFKFLSWRQNHVTLLPTMQLNTFLRFGWLMLKLVYLLKKGLITSNRWRAPSFGAEWHSWDQPVYAL